MIFDKLCLLLAMRFNSDFVRSSGRFLHGQNVPGIILISYLVSDEFGLVLAIKNSNGENIILIQTI